LTGFSRVLDAADRIGEEPRRARNPKLGSLSNFSPKFVGEELRLETRVAISVALQRHVAFFASPALSYKRRTGVGTACRPASSSEVEGNDTCSGRKSKRKQPG
jgi:hypothetical protein